MLRSHGISQICHTYSEDMHPIYPPLPWGHTPRLRLGVTTVAEDIWVHILLLGVVYPIRRSIIAEHLSMRKFIISKHKKPLYKRGIMHGKLSVANRYRVSQMPSKTNTPCSYAHYKSRGVLLTIKTVGYCPRLYVRVSCFPQSGQTTCMD